METGNRNKIVLAVAIVVAIVITAWQFGYRSASNKKIQSYKEEIKAEFVGTSLVMPEGTEIKQLSGLIKSINGKTITVELSYPKDLFGDQSLNERSIVLDGDTAVTLRVGGGPPFFDKINGEASSLKVGQMINITTAENVKDKKTFTAQAIEVWESQPVQRLDL